jgi:hypothetical protein
MNFLLSLALIKNLNIEMYRADMFTYSEERTTNIISTTVY